jgi:hypothetical protein
MSTFKTIGVRFDGTSTVYTYKAPVGMTLATGDTVIVEDPYKRLTAVKVVRIDATPQIDENAKFTYKWIESKAIVRPQIFSDMEDLDVH